MCVDFVGPSPDHKGRERLMARIIVTTDSNDGRRAPVLSDEAVILLDERVDAVHLCDDHAAEQLIERLRVVRDELAGDDV